MDIIDLLSVFKLLEFKETQSHILLCRELSFDGKYQLEFAKRHAVRKLVIPQFELIAVEKHNLYQAS